MLGTLLSFPAFAADDIPLNASDRAAIVQTLAAKLNANYIEPTVAERVGSAIVMKNAQGGYASAASVKTFSVALATDLREFSGDKHFGARLDERFPEPNRAAKDDNERAKLQRLLAMVEKGGSGEAGLHAQGER